MARQCPWMAEGKEGRHPPSTPGCPPAPPAPGQYPAEINTGDPQWGDQNTPRSCGGLWTRLCHGGVGREGGNAQVGFVPLTTLGSWTVISLTSRKLKLL